MSPQSWAEEQAARIAQEIRRLRREHGRSAQWLADRTAELGYTVTRAVIADLESGRRKYVTTAELIVLARALNTAPVGLLYPDTGSSDPVEMFPGIKSRKIVALQWFSAEVDTPSMWVCDRAEEYYTNLKLVRDARRIAELEEHKAELMKVFQGRDGTKWDDVPEAIEAITTVNREIDRLKGEHGW